LLHGQKFKEADARKGPDGLRYVPADDADGAFLRIDPPLTKL